MTLTRKCRSIFRKSMPLLLAISFVAQTSASKAAEDLLITKGNKAPFTGVLVPEANYRFYQAMVTERDVLSQKLLADSYCPGNDSDESTWPWIGGFILGAGAMFIAYSK